MAWKKAISWGFKQKPTCFQTKQVEAKPLKTKQVEADHFNQSTRVAQAVKSSTGSNVEHRVCQTHNKPTKQQEKALAIDSGVDRCASAWRKVEKFLKTLPHKPFIWIIWVNLSWSWDTPNQWVSSLFIEPASLAIFLCCLFSCVQDQATSGACSAQDTSKFNNENEHLLKLHS